MIYIDILLIAFIVVAVLDVSGFYDEVYLMVKRWLTGGRFASEVNYIKPWSCSLCMTHHIALIYVIIAGAFSLGVWAYIMMVALLTPVIKEAVFFIRDFILKVFTEMTEYFQL